MALSYQKYTVTDAADKTYLFTLSYRVQSTIEVWLQTPPGAILQTTEFSLSGTEGNLTITLTGTAASNLAIDDVIKIVREEPITKADRAVVFQPGSLQAEDLNAAIEQNLNGLMQISDSVDNTIKLETGSEDTYDAEGLRLINLATPTVDEDAVTKKYVDDVILASGNLPSPALSNDNDLISVQSAAWSITPPSDFLLLKTGNLSDLPNAATARTNLSVPGLDSNDLIDKTYLPPGTATEWLFFSNVGDATEGERHGSNTDETWEKSYTGLDSEVSAWHKLAIEPETVSTFEVSGSEVFDVDGTGSTDLWNSNSIGLITGQYYIEFDAVSMNTHASTTAAAQNRIVTFDEDTGDNKNTEKQSRNVNIGPLQDTAPIQVVSMSHSVVDVTGATPRRVSFDVRNPINLEALTVITARIKIKKLN